MNKKINFLIVKSSEILVSNVKDIQDQILDYVASEGIETEEDKNCLVENINIGNYCKVRFKILEKDELTYIIFSGAQDHTDSSKKFNIDSSYFFDFLESYTKEIKDIEDRYQGSLRKLTHNLTAYVAQSLQEAELLLPQNGISKKSWREKERQIISLIQNNERETAKTILKMAKYTQGMKTEISIYNKLRLPNPSLTKEKHNVHRVLTNSLYFFFPDFIDNEIEVELDPCKLEASFDYESISVALYHFFSNAAKYAMPRSYIQVQMKEEAGFVKILMNMKSLQILANERESIFLEGTRGAKAKLYNSEGNGVGMFMIKEIVKLNKGEFIFGTRKESLILFNDIPYEENLFEIKLPK